MTAEEMGVLPEYMALARLLQPALVVIEDADLIARDRSELRQRVRRGDAESAAERARRPARAR